MRTIEPARFAPPLLVMGVLLLGACQNPSAKPESGAAPEPKRTSFSKQPKEDPVLPKGFTCCNLHRENDWISDTNYLNSPMIPAGTPATVKKYGRHRAHVDLDGKPMRLGHDYGRKEESLESWTAKMIVTEDPKARIAGFSQPVQDAIKVGQISLGMTREQVIIAVGYPLTNENPALDAPRWRMWVSESAEYHIMWNSDGTVKDIVADPVTRNFVVYRP